MKTRKNNPIVETVNDANTVSSIIEHPNGIIIDNMTGPEQRYDILDPQYQDKLTQSFIKITDHNAYIKSLMDIATDDSVAPETAYKCAEYNQNGVWFGTGADREIVVANNIFPDMFLSVCDTNKRIFESENITDNRKVGLINLANRDAVQSRIHSMESDVVAKAWIRTIELFTEALLCYINKFVYVKLDQKDTDFNDKLSYVIIELQILQNDGYMRASLDSYEIVRELLFKKHKDGDVRGFVPMMETYANSAIMRLYDNMEFMINEAITKWYSSNAVFLTLCEQREILRINDIRTMALDAMCKSLYVAKSDFLEMLNTVVLNVETWMEIPEGFNELAKKNSRGGRYDDDYDYYY